MPAGAPALPGPLTATPLCEHGAPWMPEPATATDPLVKLTYRRLFLGAPAPSPAHRRVTAKGFQADTICLSTTGLHMGRVMTGVQRGSQVNAGGGAGAPGAPHGHPSLRARPSLEARAGARNRTAGRPDASAPSPGPPLGHPSLRARPSLEARTSARHRSTGRPGAAAPIPGSAGALAGPSSGHGKANFRWARFA